MLELDHVILGVPNLETAAQDLYKQFGLASLPGGRHPRWGTANRIVPLGSEYIELLAVIAPEDASGSPLAHLVQAQVTDIPRLIGWCLRTEDLDAVAGRLQVVPQPGSRALPDGKMLHWRSAGVGLDAELPFFISWMVPDNLHPARAYARHKNQPRGIKWVEVAGDPERIHRWIGEHRLAVHVRSGFGGLLAVCIETSSGDIILRNR